MAKKPIKKITKKTPAKVAPKAAVKAAPVASSAPAAATPCGCGCGCKRGWLKKIICFVVIFALGFAVCCAICNCNCMKKMFGGKHHAAKMVLFDKQGCLNMDKVADKFPAEKIATADADADGCVSREEFRNMMPAAGEMKQGMKKDGDKKQRRPRRHQQNQQ